MSCSDRRLFLLGALALGGPLGGCGFRPLYGGGAGTGPGRLFQSVRVERESGERGFRLHESLVERLRPVAGAPAFALTTRTELQRSGLAIEDDDQVTRYNIRLITTYTLPGRRGSLRCAPRHGESPLHRRL